MKSMGIGIGNTTGGDALRLLHSEDNRPLVIWSASKVYLRLKLLS